MAGIKLSLLAVFIGNAQNPLNQFPRSFPEQMLPESCQLVMDLLQGSCGKTDLMDFRFNNATCHHYNGGQGHTKHTLNSKYKKVRTFCGYYFYGTYSYTGTFMPYFQV